MRDRELVEEVKEVKEVDYSTAKPLVAKTLWVDR